MRIKGYSICQWLNAIKHIVQYIIPAKICSGFSKRERIWLFSERIDEARDNGKWLYNYSIKTDDGIKKYYAIDSQCNDVKNLCVTSNVVNWGSLRHYLIYYRATAIISTGFDIGAPDILAMTIIRKCLPFLTAKGKRVFLQHGITKDYMLAGTKNKLDADLFVCGAYPEYKYVSETFGYEKNEVQYLGFPRFDNLTPKSTNNFILYMPTWRSWLYEDQISDSEYYRGIVDFISNQNIINLMTESGKKLVFFLHPKFKKYKSMFSQYEICGVVEILSNDDCDLQELLMDTSMLITDYSSVFFDVAYMKKPIIYYQFDYNTYRRKQYQQGYFDYKIDGFGPVVEDVESLHKVLKEYVRVGTDKKYTDRINAFFPLHDTNNCKRVYDAIFTLEDLDAARN